MLIVLFHNLTSEQVQQKFTNSSETKYGKFYFKIIRYFPKVIHKRKRNSVLFITAGILGTFLNVIHFHIQKYDIKKYFVGKYGFLMKRKHWALESARCRFKFIQLLHKLKTLVSFSKKNWDYYIFLIRILCRHNERHKVPREHSRCSTNSILLSPEAAISKYED